MASSSEPLITPGLPLFTQAAAPGNVAAQPPPVGIQPVRPCAFAFLRLCTHYPHWALWQMPAQIELQELEMLPNLETPNAGYELVATPSPIRERPPPDSPVMPSLPPARIKRRHSWPLANGHRMNSA